MATPHLYSRHQRLEVIPMSSRRHMRHSTRSDTLHGAGCAWSLTNCMEQAPVCHLKVVAALIGPCAHLMASLQKICKGQQYLRLGPWKQIMHNSLLGESAQPHALRDLVQVSCRYSKTSWHACKKGCRHLILESGAMTWSTGKACPRFLDWQTCQPATSAYK